MAYESHEFYCVLCGQKGIPVGRTGRQRERGHLKKLFCLHCGKETNHCEIRVGLYTYEQFMFEFQHNNFDAEGNRKQTFGQLKDEVFRNGETMAPDGLSWFRKNYICESMV